MGAGKPFARLLDRTAIRSGSERALRATAKRRQDDESRFHAFPFAGGIDRQLRPACSRRMQALSQRCYFFFPKLGCHPAVFWLGAAAIVLIFSFLGFLDSRLPFCSPLAIGFSLEFSQTRLCKFRY